MSGSRWLGGAMVVCAVVAARADPVIVNGSFTDQPGVFRAAAGWTVERSSPDVADVDGPFNFTGTPWIESPDGGTWARGVGLGSDHSEAITQPISGFEVGVPYAFEFWQTNTGVSSPGDTGPLSGASGHWELLIDGVPIGRSPDIARPTLVGDPNQWHAASVSFTATSASHTLTLVAERHTIEVAPAHMGIDGVSIRRLPGPGAAWVIAAAGLAGLRRRR
jgi:hypothetical protein